MKYRRPLIFAGLGMAFGTLAVFCSPSFFSFSSSMSVAGSPGSEIVGAETNALESIKSTQTAAQDPESPSDRQETVVVEEGDTLLGVLIRSGVDQKEAHDSVQVAQTVYNPRTLRSGDTITVTFAAGEDNIFQGFSLTPTPERKVLVARNDAGGFSTTELTAELSEQIVRFEGSIESSLFAAASEAGVPPRVLAEMIRIFSFDIDFQRDVQKGDRFELMFKQTTIPDGRMVGDIELIYAAMTLSGKTLSLYRYVDAQGILDYYNEKGESVRKALLRTPINGARLSSGFGSRKHPILGYTRMHKGVDFAAPTGTPILSSGDGVVKMAKVFSGYGNYVRVQHNSEWSTAYAHLSAYGPGIKEGKRIRQGDVIGYVGSTGMATGPHLHYEILKNGTQVNPAGVRFPTGRKLAGGELARFQSVLVEAQRVYATLPLEKPERIAQTSVPPPSRGQN